MGISISRINQESPNQMEEVYNIRYKVFVQEQKVSQERDRDEWDENMNTLHYLVYYQENAVATCRVRPYVYEKEPVYKIERVCVLKDYRNLGLGKKLLELIITEFKDKPLYLQGQCTAEKFYNKIGFKDTGERLIDAGLEHMGMIKTIDKQQAS